jgi:hypothetical membrane protein
VAAAVIAWLVIGVSWYLNSSWFNFWEHAFSDLGVPGRANYYWVYNYGLMLTGLLVVGYGLYIYMWSGHKLEVLGSAFMMMAGVFLALIGVFPGGTRPHVFVSTWFFVQMNLALLPLTYAAWRYRGFKWGLPCFLSAVAAFPLYIAVDLLYGWPSVAAGEAYGILVIDAIVVALTLCQCRGGCRLLSASNTS